MATEEQNSEYALRAYLTFIQTMLGQPIQYIQAVLDQYIKQLGQASLDISQLNQFTQKEIIIGAIDLFSPVDVAYNTISLPIVGQVMIPMVVIPPHLRTPGILKGFKQ